MNGMHLQVNAYLHILTHGMVWPQTFSQSIVLLMKMKTHHTLLLVVKQLSFKNSFIKQRI